MRLRLRKAPIAELLSDPTTDIQESSVDDLKGSPEVSDDPTTDTHGASVDELQESPEVSQDQKLIPLDEILVIDQRRSLQNDKVADLAESIRTLGLLSPIAVRRVGGANKTPDAKEGSGSYRLVYGLHRLTAARQLGWKEIPCRIFSSSKVNLGKPHLSDMADGDRHALMVEIAENLHRAELTALERAEHIADWIKLKWGAPSGEKSEEVKGKGRGRPQGGRSAAAREIGISEPDARRSERIAGLPDEVKAEAKALGLDDNQAAPLKATVASDPITVLRDHATSPERASSGLTAEPAPSAEVTHPASGSVGDELRAVMAAIRCLCLEDRDSLIWWMRVTYSSDDKRQRVNWF
jgi:ParB/Sulfiredoxin domain